MSIKPKRKPPTAAELHRAWLELVDTEGPFLSVPTVKRVWPQGMPPLADDRKAALSEAKPAFEKAWENWDTYRDSESALDLYRTERDTWVDIVLREVIGWVGSYTTEHTQTVRSPDHKVAVTTAGALAHGDLVGALVLVVDPVDSLRDPGLDGWSDSPIDRMTQLLRETGVEIGVVTDGRWWGIVCARPKESVASGIVDAHTWIEEPQTRNAFFALLARRQLVGGVPEDRLPKLFAESVKSAEEITEALGTQVRQAVELLVQALSESALTVVERGEPDPLPADRRAVYEAAVTMMMRVVFLLFAEQRQLLPESELFTRGYGLSDELDILDARARDEGTEALDATHMTWHRLLATSRALYQGASFEDMRIPSYGGSLFDPERFGFLTARDDRGLLIAVSDRVMLAVLTSVQVAVVKGAASRISFRDIDVEQIGYIYEGLLGYSCADVDEVTVGLIGKAGSEPEIPLRILESLAAANPDPTKLAAALISWAKADQPAATSPTASALAKAIKAADTVEDADRALRAVTTDAELRDRLRPFISVIRRDLRDRPYVVHPGGVLVVETASRASAGAHYTPKNLAEEVVRYALEPLVYSPGPHQTTGKWKLLSSDQILRLKVADIACGSGAFLVAAARYLADRLLEAWEQEGIATGPDLRTKAIRHVVASCLYGADINSMAVEMCKLSLWLVSLDPKLPFSFVDDKIFHGNTLLGLTSVEQLEDRHIYPTDQQISFSGIDIRARLDEVAQLRRSLATEINDLEPQRSATTKRRQFARTQELTTELADIADGVVAAGLRLGGKPGKPLTAAYQELSMAVDKAFPTDGSAPDRVALEQIQREGLTPTVATDYARWKPFHWILAVPDVFEHGGFDAIVGNPPFLGGKKISGATGSNFREWLVHVLAQGHTGNTDLVAYFLLRAASLLNPRGNIGLIATNTIAQGDTREVGLDSLVANGVTLTRAIQSRSWPSASANLEFAAVWGTKETIGDDIPRIADNFAVRRISPMLEPAGRAEGNPVRLAENSGMAFIGCYALGMGFVLAPNEAANWIATEPANKDVLFPYLNGEDLNSRPDVSASRWVIDFNDQPESIAAKYGMPYARLLNEVRPERLRKPKAVREAPWWLFFRARPAMRKAIARLDEVLVITRVSKTVMPLRCDTGQVFTDSVTVFATDSLADQAVLSSSLHQAWAIAHGTTMRIDPTYTPSAVFETFPRPDSTNLLHVVGRTLDTERREIMLRRELGLTALYNRASDPAITADPDIARLRTIHIELDNAVMAAYGWDDVPLDHGFHTYRQMRRWTVSPTARIEILDRLLEENHRRAAAQRDAPNYDPSLIDDSDQALEGDE
ncbi:Eco57I restriction-modification methylase domain-containing protein [Nocardia lasii]|uniref:site-specific DNA-methyltransferase (adenine-specific) n=1 Tax=Nocardia lasii TaxID=1616107 RepID=A0ABW1JN99_9NOCA